ncbi:hypothetical protein [Pseudonocardia cypriaca]|uniref:Uncharacterized protein n=1 Tax=Pseudonocardia cypriaca TaxID=882449 RepID=A0A543FT86_9PSEU|nr:hypothetical protein [Pseudonocardia cypriaca]TQM37013.1 hypothetical protein FB388_4212 [Pseudonocardia cypriaca]
MNLLDAVGARAPAVALSTPLRALLAALEIHGETVTGRVDRMPFGLLHLDLAPGGPAVPYRLTTAGDGFALDLLLSRVDPLPAALTDPTSFLRPATRHTDATGAWLEPAAGAVRVQADLALRIAGTPAQPAEARLLPLIGPEPAEAVLELRLTTPYVLFGDTGFGLGLPNGLVLDDSATAPTGAAAWRGAVLRGAELYVPRGIPLVGGTVATFDVALQRAGGIDAVVTVPVDRGQVELEWHDPAATGLADLLPTVVQVTVNLPVRGRTVDGGQGSFTLGGADPLRLRGRFARDLRASPPVMSFDLAVDGGELVTVSASTAPGKVVVTAAALATALVAESRLQPEPPPSGDETGPWLSALLTAATAATTFFDDTGTVVIEAVRLHGTTSSTESVLQLEVDYVVDVTVRPVEAGPFAIWMDGSQPMRIRYRGVRVEADPRKPGISGLAVSFAQAGMDLEDPGGWRVRSPGSVLDVIGTRSGRGSVWFDVDLRFTLDLGPVTVSDATVRITVENPGPPPQLTLELRGLGVRLEAGLLTAHGGAVLTDGGFTAELDATLGDPVGVSARAQLTHTSESLTVEVEGSLPGPIPLGPTLLGLYGLGGTVGLNARPVLPPGDDLVEQQLSWTPNHVEDDPGSVMLGALVSIGTLHDWGFTYSGHGRLLVTLPDPSLRIATKVRILQPRAGSMAETAPLRGILVVDEDGITVGARGSLTIDHLLDLQIPVGGRLPFHDPGSWYLDVGTDGYGDRKPGPVTAKVLPDILDLGGSAYLMLHGAGLPHLGGVEPDISLPGPAIGFGVQARFTLGMPSVCWVSVGLTLRAGTSTNPLFLSATGRLDGALHLGPFSLGAHADLALRVGPGDDVRASFRICGSIDLWFTEIEGCVDIELPPGAASTPEVPIPDTWPDPLLVLSDRDYRALDTPEVLPDVLPILQFPLGPAAEAVSTPFTITGGANAGDGRTGNDLLSYTYTLESVRLTAADGTAVGGDAAWQQPKHALGPGSAATPGARELALLTYRTDLWAARRSDGGKGHPADPVKAAQQGCHDSHRASTGWALGAGASVTERGAHLPADPVRPGRHPSVFTAELELDRYHALPLTEIGVAPLLVPAGFLGLRAAPWEPPTEVPGSDHLPFAGVVRLPCFTGTAEVLERTQPFAEEPWLRAAITPSDELVDATLWVASRGEVQLDDRPGRIVSSLPDGTPVWVFPVGAIAGPLRLSWYVGAEVLVLGLQGVTRQASDDAAAVAVHTARTQQTITAKRGRRPRERTPIALRPDTRYRIDAEVRAVGTLAGTSRDFEPRPVSHWFTTAARLDPAALTRYLSGYTPGDRTLGWYLDDPLAAHFAHDHVPALAQAYGFGIDLALRRTDDPPHRPAAPPPGWLALGATVTELLEPGVLPPWLRRYLDEPAACPVPPAGLSVQADPGLAPRATYDLAVALIGPGSPRLPGITFTTSRYRNPAAQLAELGFPGTVTGHLPVDPAVLPHTGTTSDAALATVLETGIRWPGVEPEEQAWAPVGETGRSTALWAADGVDGAGGVIGILLESPEPLFRPGRAELTGLAGFPVAVRDRSGCRVLFCTRAPLPGPRTVMLSRTERGVAKTDLPCALPEGWR